jgi:malate dehydrogenase (oxaloacetate-decarboxylating)
MDEWEVFPREATAVGMKAIEQGIARCPMSRDDLFAKSSAIIKKARQETIELMKSGLIEMGD